MGEAFQLQDNLCLTCGRGVGAQVLTTLVGGLHSLRALKMLYIFVVCIFAAVEIKQEGQESSAERRAVKEEHLSIPRSGQDTSVGRP